MNARHIVETYFFGQDYPKPKFKPGDYIKFIGDPENYTPCPAKGEVFLVQWVNSHTSELTRLKTNWGWRVDTNRVDTNPWLNQDFELATKDDIKAMAKQTLGEAHKYQVGSLVTLTKPNAPGLWAQFQGETFQVVALDDHLNHGLVGGYYVDSSGLNCSLRRLKTGQTLYGRVSTLDSYFVPATKGQVRDTAKGVLGEAVQCRFKHGDLLVFVGNAKRYMPEPEHGELFTMGDVNVTKASGTNAYFTRHLRNALWVADLDHLNQDFELATHDNIRNLAKRKLSEDTPKFPVGSFVTLVYLRGFKSPYWRNLLGETFEVVQYYSLIQIQPWAVLRQLKTGARAAVGLEMLNSCFALATKGQVRGAAKAVLGEASKYPVVKPGEVYIGKDGTWAIVINHLRSEFDEPGPGEPWPAGANPLVWYTYLKWGSLLDHVGHEFICSNNSIFVCSRLATRDEVRQLARKALGEACTPRVGENYVRTAGEGNVTPVGKLVTVVKLDTSYSYNAYVHWRILDYEPPGRPNYVGQLDLPTFSQAFTLVGSQDVAKAAKGLLAKKVVEARATVKPGEVYLAASWALVVNRVSGNFSDVVRFTYLYCKYRPEKEGHEYSASANAIFDGGGRLATPAEVRQLALDTLQGRARDVVEAKAVLGEAIKAGDVYVSQYKTWAFVVNQVTPEKNPTVRYTYLWNEYHPEWEGETQQCSGNDILGCNARLATKAEVRQYALAALSARGVVEAEVKPHKFKAGDILKVRWLPQEVRHKSLLFRVEDYHFGHSGYLVGLTILNDNHGPQEWNASASHIEQNFCLATRDDIRKVALRTLKEDTKDSFQLIHAVMAGDKTVAVRALHIGADVNYSLGSPLDWASFYGDVEMMKLLLQFGADENLDSAVNDAVAGAILRQRGVGPSYRRTNNNGNSFYDVYDKTPDYQYGKALELLMQHGGSLSKVNPERLAQAGFARGTFRTSAKNLLARQTVEALVRF